MLAGSTTDALFNLLSEIQLFLWHDGFSRRRLEVFIRYHPILVGIKVLEHKAELSISQIEAPVQQIASQLLGLNEPRLVLVQVSESLLKGLPLRSDLVKDGPSEVHLLNLLFKHPPIESLVPVGDHFGRSLVLRVLVGVVSEVEALALLDDAAKPFAEVSIVNAAPPLVVFVYD